MIQEPTNTNLRIPISKEELPTYLQFPLASTLIPVILKIAQLGLMIQSLSLVQTAPSAVTFGTEGRREALSFSQAIRKSFGH